jgi:N-acylneuraminate cytidylyltransferase
MSQIVVYIPVRGGSKSLPRKNINLLAGRPLLHWTLAAAVESREVERVYVGTDDAEIARVAMEFNHPKISVVDRPPETATDTASTESALLDFARRHEFKQVILMQATSPLTETSDLDQALVTLRASAADSLVTVVRQKRFIWNEESDRGLVTPGNYDPVHRPRRQEWDGFLVENGAFYITSRAGLLASGCRLNGKVVAHVMADETYFELDEPSDWAIIGGLLYNRARAKGPVNEIKIFLTDLDGVLTDGGMYYTEFGDEAKKFNTRDGKGFELLRNAGLITGIVTGEKTTLNERRAAKLKLDILEQGADDKVAVISRLLAERGLGWNNLAYMGDDINDLEVLRRAGFSGVPADAEPLVRSVANLICARAGGRGCVREFIGIILAART